MVNRRLLNPIAKETSEERPYILYNDQLSWVLYLADAPTEFRPEVQPAKDIIHQLHGSNRAFRVQNSLLGGFLVCFCFHKLEP